MNYKQAISNIEGLLDGLADSLQAILDHDPAAKPGSFERYMDAVQSVPGLIDLKNYYQQKQWEQERVGND